ncbi:hypothetical protein V6N13_069046 [Hibiscus sabdariffa]
MNMTAIRTALEVFKEAGWAAWKLLLGSLIDLVFGSIALRKLSKFMIKWRDNTLAIRLASDGLHRQVRTVFCFCW